MIVKSLVDLIDPHVAITFIRQDGVTDFLECPPEVDRCEVEAFVMYEEDQRCKIWYVQKEPAMVTNFERLAASEYILAEFLSRVVTDCEQCPIHDLCYAEENFDRDWECEDVWREWLDSERSA